MTDMDIMLMEALTAISTKFIVVMTKWDKAKKSVIEKHISDLKIELAKHYSKWTSSDGLIFLAASHVIHMTSSQSQYGIEELIAHLAFVTFQETSRQM